MVWVGFRSLEYIAVKTPTTLHLSGTAEFSAYTLRHRGHIPQILVRLEFAEYLQSEHLEQMQADVVMFRFGHADGASPIVPAEFCIRRNRAHSPQIITVSMSCTHNDYRAWHERTRDVPFWKLILKLPGDVPMIAHRFTPNGKGLRSERIHHQHTSTFHHLAEEVRYV